MDRMDMKITGVLGAVSRGAVVPVTPLAPPASEDGGRRRIPPWIDGFGCVSGGGVPAICRLPWRRKCRDPVAAQVKDPMAGLQAPVATTVQGKVRGEGRRRDGDGWGINPKRCYGVAIPRDLISVWHCFTAKSWVVVERLLVRVSGQLNVIWIILKKKMLFGSRR
jgi:hypothetical protein